ncbi:Crp/Fnr family transcriptional regulator [Lacrimispora sp. 38-1]|uniref:Crp/Fnr family transcriptional regulator n=1 Tax=Lacrimispora sp. 38-1 TaxID=3125778 RepID=UPI003CF70B79
MNDYIPLLIKMPLFRNIPSDKYDNVFSCLHARVRDFEKGETICGMNEPVHNAGIVLSGKVNISLLNKAGSEHSIRQFNEGTLFGEALACVPEEYSTVQIVSVEASKILFLCFSQLFSEKAKACPYASQVALNLLHEVAKKNIFLNKKVEILAQKKIRDKISIYFQLMSEHSASITVPLNRQEMASFLGIDRSALSRELSFMREEGLIEFRKNEFVLLKSSLI